MAAAPYVLEHVVESDEEDDDLFSSNPPSEDESDADGSSSFSMVTKSEESAPNTKQQTDKSDEEDEKSAVGNVGWANAMAKVLRKVTATTNKKSVILAKGKTDEETAEKKRKKYRVPIKRSGFVIVAREGENGTTKSEENETKEKPKEKSQKEIIRELAEKRLKKRKWIEMGRVKPDITAREKERFFQRVATAGVVQLFNAVKQRQMNLESKLENVGSSEVKRDRVMKSMTKGDFLDALKNAKSVEVPKEKSRKKRRVKDEEKTKKPTWNVLSDNFMMGAKMRDWGKESDSDNDEGKVQRNDSDSSDD